MKKPYELLLNVLSLNRHTRIKLLGDSITHGVGGTDFKQNGVPIVRDFARNPDGYCWANKFKNHIEQKFGASVVNNACTGTNIEFIINNFETLVDEEDDIIICTIGTNNRHIYFEAGSKPTREELGTQFYNNIVKLYDMFVQIGKDVIFVANIPASAANEKDGETFWRILHMDDINTIYRHAAEKLNFPFISLYDLFTEYCESNSIMIDSLLCDGLHPNDQGYDVMYDLICKELRLFGI